jgi:hypothetical protein
MTFGQAWNALRVAALLVMVSVSIAAAQVFRDDFDNTKSQLWTTNISGSGPTLVETNGAVRLTP